MNDIKSKINKEINDFYQWNMIWPNELWVGLKEKAELENYMNSSPISLDNERVFLTEKSNLQLDGLKIRLKDTSSYFKIYYNPHY
jgi:hypothetical protein